jgi:rare lipoprotein A
VTGDPVSIVRLAGATRRATRLRLAALAVSLAFASACASRTPAPVSHPIPPEQVTPAWSEEGLASWYGGSDGFEGKPTASGEIFDGALLTAAHRDLPLGTIVDVTNVETGATVRVRINDRGPFVHGRIIDLSQSAARRVGVIAPGVAMVRLTIAEAAPMPALSAAAVPQTGGWAVQVGSFAERDRADRHAGRLRAAGFDVYLEPFQGLTRVKVGPLETRGDAEEKLAQVEAAGFEGVVMPQ